MIKVVCPSCGELVPLITDENKVSKEQAREALIEAVQKGDVNAQYFWSGYLAALW